MSNVIEKLIHLAFMVKDYPKKVIEAIQGGIHQDFWLRGVKYVLNEEIKTLSDQILEDNKGERLTDEKRNHLIDLRLIVKKLIKEVEDIAIPEEPEAWRIRLSEFLSTHLQ